jgi:hypothetical protein
MTYLFRNQPEATISNAQHNINSTITRNNNNNNNADATGDEVDGGNVARKNDKRIKGNERQDQ